MSFAPMIPRERQEGMPDTPQAKVSHTPGPWKHYIDNEGYLVVDLGPRCLGSTQQICLGDMEDTEGEDHANAALIAAAPDLLAALKAFPHEPQASTWMQAEVDWYWKVCAPAIAKAGGRQP